MKSVFILNTGIANIASVYASLTRLDCEISFINSPEEILSDKPMILPGVGSFEAGMNSLRSCGFEESLKERIKIGLPTLCICLGMQLLCKESEESKGISGLGIINQSAKKFLPPLRVPHFGWNQVINPKTKESEYAYFANSFYLSEVPAGWDYAFSEYGNKFISLIRRGNVLATQFHPELSGKYGSVLISQWLEEASC